jgi:hypothetical protein
MSRMMKSCAYLIPVVRVNGRNDFKIVSFNHLYPAIQIPEDRKLSSESQVISSFHLSPKPLKYFYILCSVKDVSNILIARIKNRIKESTVQNVEVDLDR